MKLEAFLFRLRPDHFDFLKTIGKGSFGRVYLVKYKANEQIYAMKILGKARILKRNEIKYVFCSVQPPLSLTQYASDM